MNGDPKHLEAVTLDMMENLDLDCALDRVVERLNTALVKHGLVIISEEDLANPDPRPYLWKSIPDPVRQRGRG